MSPRLRSKNYTESSTLEALLVLGSIISTKFFVAIRPLLSRKAITNAAVTYILKECGKYFDRYNRVPGQDIFKIMDVAIAEVAMDETQESVLESVRTVLDHLKDQISSGVFNADYAFTACSDYIKKQELINRCDEIEAYRKAGRMDKVEEVFSATSESLFSAFAPSYDLFDLDLLKAALSPEQHLNLIEMPGDLGWYFKKVSRSKFYGLLGPTKRGKSQWLNNLALWAWESELNVLKISLELRKEEDALRSWAGLAGVRLPEEAHQKFFYNGSDGIDRQPELDCEKNQRGLCDCDWCQGTNVNIFNPKTKRPEDYLLCPDHTPCAYCLGNEDREIANLYEASSWMARRHIPQMMTLDNYQEITDEFRLTMPSRGGLRNYAFPAGTATLNDIVGIIEREIHFNEWVPDVLIIDSADNFRKNQKLGERRFQLSDIWEQLKLVTDKYNLLTFSATQGNRGSFGKQRLGGEDIAEDVSKLFVVDGFYAINERNGKTPAEFILSDKYWSRQFIECLFHRSANVIPGRQIMVLNDFWTYRVALNSATCYYKSISGL